MSEQDETTFLAEYDPRSFPPVAVTVDVAALTIRDGELCVLVVERATHPQQGRVSLPGAFPRPQEELLDAAMRAIASKTGLRPPVLEQLQTFGSPYRDPRMRVYSIAYMALGPFDGEPSPGYHTAKAEWTPFGSPIPWAFDHEQIAWSARQRVQDKMEYTPLATRFLPDTFTMSELMEVYSIVWGKPINAGNFYRKVKATKGFVERTGEMRGRSEVYRAGDARMLYPSIRREPEDWS